MGKKMPVKYVYPTNNLSQTHFSVRLAIALVPARLCTLTACLCGAKQK